MIALLLPESRFLNTPSEIPTPATIDPTMIKGIITSPAKKAAICVGRRTELRESVPVYRAEEGETRAREIGGVHRWAGTGSFAGSCLPFCDMCLAVWP